MYGLVGVMIAGLVVGALAKLLMPGKDPGGIIITILLGIAGSLLGSWVGLVMGFYSAGEPAGFLMSVLGAILLLFGYRLIKLKAV